MSATTLLLIVDALSFLAGSAAIALGIATIRMRRERERGR